MEWISKTVFNEFQVRKSKRQKDFFCAWVQETSAARGIPCHMECSRHKYSRNIILGNPDTADVILTAHYDTCARLPFPNLLFPNHMILTVLVQLLFLLPWFVLWFGISLGISVLGGTSALLFDVVWIGGLAVMMYLLFNGPASPHTANDNTSGVITVLRCMWLFPASQHVAAVLFDHEEQGLLGSAAFARQHRKCAGETPVINFDCVSDGDDLFFIASPAAEKHPLYASLRTYMKNCPAAGGKTFHFVSSKQSVYPSDQKNFACGIGAAAFRKAGSWPGYYLSRIHTPRDTVFDEVNINLLVSTISGWLKEMEKSA